MYRQRQRRRHPGAASAIHSNLAELRQPASAESVQTPRALPLQTTAASSGHRIARMGVVRPQAKLTVGAPDDIYEQEADRVAQQVMTAPDPQVALQSEEEEEEDLLQTKPVAGTITPLVQRQDEEEEDLQMQPDSGAAAPLIQRQELPEEEEEEPAIQAKGKAQPSRE